MLGWGLFAICSSRAGAYLKGGLIRGGPFQGFLVSLVGFQGNFIKLRVRQNIAFVLKTCTFSRIHNNRLYENAIPYFLNAFYVPGRLLLTQW